jgi:hypothetical protein
VGNPSYSAHPEGRVPFKPSVLRRRKRYPANTKAELLALEEVGITGEDEEEDQTGDMITIYF